MKLLIIIGLLFPAMSWAGSLSLEAVGVSSPSPLVYVSQDNRLQYSGENWFVAIEQIHVCPDYCGVTFNLAGGGFLKTIHYNKVSLFAQFGFYYVKNTSGYSKDNENLYYYMINRFNGGQPASFTGYRVNNGNALGAQVGLKIPFSNSFGMRVYYRHLQFWTNYVAYLPNGYWHDPVTAKYNGYGMGVYYNF